MQALEKSMGHPPRALVDRPTLAVGLQLYWDTYRRLSRGRQWSDSGPQAIMVSECLAYCAGIGLTDSGLPETILDYVQEMDAVFLEHVQKKRSDTSSKTVVAPE